MSYVGIQLTGSDGTWTGSPSFARQWRRALPVSGAPPSLIDANWTAISGATSTTYTPVSGDTGYYLTYRVAATNTGGTTVAYAPAVGPVSAVPVSGVTVPTVLVEVAFTADPGVAAPVWTDVSDYVLSGSVKRGRAKETEKVQAGTATVTLDNRDRRFDPSNTNSPYYPNVVPMRRLRVSMVWNNVTYRLFTGYVDSWPQEWEGPAGRCVVGATDGYVLINNALFASTTSRNVERSDQRIAWVLDQIGWPSAMRALDIGRVDIQAYDFDRYNAIQHIEEVVDTEQGLFFLRGDGYAVFKNRHHRLRAPYVASNATFGENAGELPYTDMELTQDTDIIRNDIRVRKASIEEPLVFVASDATSQARYLVRGEQLDLWGAWDAEIESVASMRLLRFKDAETRISKLTVSGQHDSSIWPHALGLDLGSRITVNQRFFAKGSVLSQPSRIEAIEQRWTREGPWTTAWDLSPVPPMETYSYWELGVAGKSELGTTTRVTF